MKGAVFASFACLAVAACSAALTPLIATKFTDGSDFAGISAYTLEPCTGKWGGKIYENKTTMTMYLGVGSYDQTENVAYLPFVQTLIAVKFSKGFFGVKGEEKWVLQGEGYGQGATLGTAFDAATRRLFMWSSDMQSEATEIGFLNVDSRAYTRVGSLPRPTLYTATGAPMTFNAATRKVVMSHFVQGGFAIAELDADTLELNTTDARKGCFPQSLAYDANSKRVAAVCSNDNGEGDREEENQSYGFLSKSGDVEILAEIKGPKPMHNTVMGISAIDAKAGAIHVPILFNYGFRNTYFLVSLDVATGKPLCNPVQLDSPPRSLFVPSF